MKKLIIYALFSLAFVFLFSSIVSADVTPSNSHSLSRCVKAVNLNEFPNIVLIGYYTGPMVDKYEAYQIKNNECLTKGYKFNSLSIYWTTKDKFNSLDLKNLKLNSEKIATGKRDNVGNLVYTDKFSPADLTLLLENVEPDGGYIDESNPLIQESVEYSIAGYSDGKLVLYKSKQISEYNDGTPKKVETFSNPLENKELNKIIPTSTPSPKITPTSSNQSIVTSTPSPEPAKRGFWQSITCFFIKLFGRSCQ